MLRITNGKTYRMYLVGGETIIMIVTNTERGVIFGTTAEQEHRAVRVLQGSVLAVEEY